MTRRGLTASASGILSLTDPLGRFWIETPQRVNCVVNRNPKSCPKIRSFASHYASIHLPYDPCMVHWTLPGSGSFPIVGTTHTPSPIQGGPHALAVVVHGFTGTKDRNIVPAVAAGLAERGVLVHRFTMSHAGVEKDAGRDHPPRRLRPRQPCPLPRGCADGAQRHRRG